MYYNVCPKCKTYKPLGNEVCSKCDFSIYPQDSQGICGVYPPNDKYGHPIQPIHFDVQKCIAREKYIQNTPIAQKHIFLINKYTKIFQNQSKSKKVKANLSIFSFIASIIIFCISVLIGMTYDSNIIAVLGVFFSTLLFFFSFVVIIFSVQNPIKTNDKLEMARIGINQVKESYYMSQYVIGFCVRVDLFYKQGFPHCNNKIFFVEIDKSNIQCITYDTELAEYILFLKEPVYVNPQLSKMYQVRLQDIFDDDLLSQVLNCSLPAKKIMF